MKLLHLLLLVYWLGADVGTFYASRFVADGSLPVAARAVAAKIMLGVDLLPRVAMPLTLASGAHLAGGLGLLPGAAVGAGWALCAAWLALVLAIHHRGAPGNAALVRFDFAGRCGVAPVLAATALWAWQGGAWPGWLAFKLAAFAATVGCGLMIRRKLAPFGPAFARLVREGADPAGDAAIAASIAACKPWVLLIWALLVACAAAGLHTV